MTSEVTRMPTRTCFPSPACVRNGNDRGIGIPRHLAGSHRALRTRNPYAAGFPRTRVEAAVRA